MATLALAAEPGVKHEHDHNVHRRDDKEVVTVYVTKYATAAINAATSTVPTSSSKSSEGAKEKIKVSQSSTSSSAQAKPSSSGKPTDEFHGDGGARGIVYSPYKAGGCKSAKEVKDDLAKLSGFSSKIE